MLFFDVEIHTTDFEDEPTYTGGLFINLEAWTGASLPLLRPSDSTSSDLFVTAAPA